MKKCSKCPGEKTKLEFYSGDNLCKECRKKESKLWAEKNPEKRKAINLTWCKNNLPLRRVKEAKIRKEKTLTLRAQYLQRKFWPELTWQEANHKFEKMLILQGGLCALCRKKSRRTLHVDHDHRSGRVRGLLCNSCNRGLGYLGDDPERCLLAAQYLKNDFDLMPLT